MTIWKSRNRPRPSTRPSTRPSSRQSSRPSSRPSTQLLFRACLASLIVIGATIDIDRWFLITGFAMIHDTLECNISDEITRPRRIKLRVNKAMNICWMSTKNFTDHFFKISTSVPNYGRQRGYFREGLWA